MSAEVNTTEEEECKSWVSTVHKYPDLDPMMAVVKNKKSRSLQLLRSHFCNVTYVDRHFFEHEPFHFETPLMVLRQKGVTLFSFSINGDDMGRFHPFFEWLDKMDKAIDSSLRNLHSNINNPTFRPSVDSLGISNCIFAIGKSDCCVTLRYPSNPRLRFTLKEIIDGKMLWTFRPLKLILSMDRAYDKIDNAYFTRFHIVEMILY